MRHQAEHVPGAADDARDVAHGAVGVPVPVGLAAARYIPEDDAPVALEAIERGFVGGIATVSVRDGHHQYLALLVAVREHRVAVLDAKTHRLADELERLVAEQRARQQPGFARNLKSVADAEERAAALRVRGDLGHDRTEAGDGTAAQVVTVTESAWKDDHIAAGEVVILVPQVDGFFTQLVDDRVIGVVIAV